MRISYFQVNAFTSKTFGGNPAGVCPLEHWLPDELLQNIAAENDFSETAFFVKENDFFHLRWFTPTTEVELCGHATLASAHVMFSELNHSSSSIRYQTKSGWLTATKREKVIELDFPSWPVAPWNAPEMLTPALGIKPREVLKSSRDCLVVFDSQDEVARLAPNIKLLSEVDALCVIATARGNDADFVSRCFAPRAGIHEDPVTGSSHCSLIPFWSQRLRKTELFARQISQRGGELHCRLSGERVGIGGEARIYCRGELEISEI